MGINQATAPLSELSKFTTDFASVFGGERGGGPITDSMQVRCLRRCAQPLLVSHQAAQRLTARTQLQ